MEGIDEEATDKLTNLSISPDLLVLEFEIEQILTRALVDSGANSNNISSTLYQSLQAQNSSIKIVPIKQRVRVGNWSSLETYTTVASSKLTFTSFPLTFDLILGMDFLKRHQAVLDVEDYSIHFKNCDPPRV